MTGANLPFTPAQSRRPMTGPMRHPFATVVGLVILLLAACGADRPLRTEKSAPALWIVEKGDLRAHIFGTIHVLPAGVAWETPTLRKATKGSDRLILEATGLDDEGASQKLFIAAGRSPGLPPVADRVPADLRPTLDGLISRGGMSAPVLDGYESWAAALLLSTATQGDLKLSGAQGVEPALTEDFKAAGKPIDGLETIASQFALFDRMPEDVQRRMLVATLRDSTGAKAQFDRMLDAWLHGDMRRIGDEFVDKVAPEPALKQALLYDRNRAWADRIATLKGRPFIAVGAAHLAGRDNVIDLLKAQGFKVKRVE